MLRRNRIERRQVLGFPSRQSKRSAILLVILLSITYAVPNPFFSSSQTQPQVDFVYTPNSVFRTSLNPSPPFVLIGDKVNFTATGSGGTPPYTSFTWNFGDGQTGSGKTVFHAFSSPATYPVMVTVTDSAGQQNSKTYPVAVQVWPVTTFGWVVRWNITQNDGINIWNVTYHGRTVIHDVRLAGVQVIYPSNFCGYFGGSFGAFYDEPFNEQAVKADGNVFYENSTDPANLWFQIRAEYRVGGYSYAEAFRFYPGGRWDAEQTIAPDGCLFDHIYEPHWRFDLALGNDSRNFMSEYTPTGAWQDLIWEGNYTDNGFRDPVHNGAQWRLGNEGMYYYIVPKIVRTDLDLPYLSSNLVLLRERPNEVDRHPEVGVVTPVEYVKGELAFRRNITFWFIPRIWDHGPLPGKTSVKDNMLSFYPYGSWP